MLAVHHVVGLREIAARGDDGERALTLAGFLQHYLDGTALCGFTILVGGMLSLEHGDALDVVGFDVADVCDMLAVHHVVGLREIVARGDDGDPALLLAVGCGCDGSGLPWHGVRVLVALWRGGSLHALAGLSIAPGEPCLQGPALFLAGGLPHGRYEDIAFPRYFIGQALSLGRGERY